MAHPHTHTHSDLSITLNGAVRLALNPEATQRGVVVWLPPASLLRPAAERSQGVFAGSSNAARSDLGKPSPSKPHSASALLALTSVQLRESVGSLRVLQPVEVRSDGGQTELHKEGRGVDSGYLR